MARAVCFTTAATLPLSELAELYSRAFAGYPYHVSIPPESLARRIHAEQIDLSYSPIICVAGEPGGVALLGLRGSETNCAGFGITRAFRGRGLAHRLMAEHLRLARLAGGRRMTLMVLDDNRAAISVYRRAGMRVWRDLLMLEWTAGTAPVRTGPLQALRIEPAILLNYFDCLHTVEPFWQRAQATLRRLDGLEGWAIGGSSTPPAYALVAREAEGGQILDLAARELEPLQSLVATLQSHYRRLIFHEPEESPYLPLLYTMGFHITYRRHELELML